MCWKVTFWTCYLDHHPRPSSKNQKRVPKNLHDVSENGVLPKEIRVKMMMNQWMLCFFTQNCQTCHVNHTTGSQVVVILLWPSIFKTLPKPFLGPRKVEIPSKQNWYCDVYSWISNCLLMFIGDQTVPNNFNRSVKNSYCWWKLNMICHQEVAKKTQVFKLQLCAPRPRNEMEHWLMDKLRAQPAQPLTESITERRWRGLPLKDADLPLKKWGMYHEEYINMWNPRNMGCVPIRKLLKIGWRKDMETLSEWIFMLERLRQVINVHICVSG